ncbi:MAG: DUF4345 family protein [Polyangiales bacterium]
MGPTWIRAALGALVSAAAVALVFSPLKVAAVLRRPHETVSQMINLRASWGGALLGIGLLVLWLPIGRTGAVYALRGVLCLMVGIAAARTVGFFLDGRPDTLQWVWLLAEFAIAAGCALALARGVGG